MSRYQAERAVQDRRRPPSIEYLQSRCDAWNKAHPIGTPVHYHSVIGGPPTLLTKTRGEAYVLSGHTAVIFIEQHAGCVALDAISIIRESSPDPREAA